MTVNPLTVPKLVFSFFCFSLLLLPVFAYLVQWIAVGVAPWDDDPPFQTRQDPPFWFNGACALAATILSIIFCAWGYRCLGEVGKARRQRTYAKLGIAELA